MTRGDYNQAFWKEKFLAGLPSVLTEKVKQKIREHNQNTIPYDNLTSGDLVNTINMVGLNIYNDLRMKSQLKRKQLENKQALGSFCEQFGYEPPTKRK